MSRVKARDGFKIDYVKMFGMGWLPNINKLLASDYMFNLMVFLDHLYNLIPMDNKVNAYRSIGYPRLTNVFENFRMTSFKDTKVVIVGKEPFRNTNATGIPFANPSSASGPVESDTLLIEACVRRYNVNVKKTAPASSSYFDETMYSWACQGVLMLDAASTSMAEIDNAHSIYWRNFTREIIKTISSKKENVIFLFWGKEASYFSKYVDKDKHKALHYCHPSDMAKQNRDWNCPHFGEVDKFLKEKYGEKGAIYW